MGDRSEDRDEARLPVWGRKIIEGLRREVAALRSELIWTKEAHAVLMDREWFPIPGPAAGQDRRGLWVLGQDDARRICALGEGDILIVGRHRPAAKPPGLQKDIVSL